MICNCFTKERLVLLICSLVVGYACIGCRSPKNYKVEADEQVYNIIDRKWQDEFSSRANYKISDTEPLPNDIQIEKAIPASGVLSLPKAVAIATAYNREYQLEKELLYTMALDLRLTRHQFEPYFFGRGRGEYAIDDIDTGIGAEASFGFDQLLASGARVSTNVGAAWLKIITGDIRSGLISILSVTVTQPLLRGSDRRVVLENLTQAERDTLYQVRSFGRFRKTFVVSIISQYYRILQLADTVKNAKQNCHTLDWLCEHVEKLAAVGRVPKEELQRIRQEKLQATDIHIQTRKEYEQALDDFKFQQLSLPVNAELQLDVNELEALRSAEPAKPSFSEPEAVEAALEQRLDLANSRDAVIDAERKVLVAADGLGADLNLIAGAKTGADARTALSTVKHLTKQIEIMVELELPLDRVAEQNIYRKALIALQQSQREHEQTRDTVTLEVRQAYRDLTEAMQRYELQSQALELAEKRLKDTCLLLRYGRASSRRALNAQRNLFQAQNEAVDALTDYNIATLNFYCAAGVLGVRPDGMWHH
jgi:outer membrane protein TolC